MFYEINGTWYVRGIVSLTDVSKYREWITRYTGITKIETNLKPCQDGIVGEKANL